MATIAKIDSPWGSQSDREAKRNSKRQAVLDTAVRLFNAKGFQATSLDYVAQALSVTKPTIYHYFSNKDDILFECLRLGMRQIQSAIGEVQQSAATGRDRLEVFAVAYALTMTQEFGMCTIRTSDDQLSAKSRKEFRALKREIHESLQAIIEDGMKDGSLIEGDARLTAFTMAGAINWIGRWYRPDQSMSPDQVAQGVVSNLMTGLVAR